MLNILNYIVYKQEKGIKKNSLITLLLIPFYFISKNKIEIRILKLIIMVIKWET